MRNKAKEVNRYRARLFSRFELISDYSQLTELLDNIITEDDKTPIIFNFCYFLASKMLDIRNLSDVMVQIAKKYSKHNMCVVYQNPALPLSSPLHANWKTLKADLSGFRSRITQSNIEQFCYDRLTNGTLHNVDVYYDILFNR